MDADRELAPRRIRYGKWAGFIGGSIAWFAHQQVSSSWIFAHCPERSMRLVLGVGLVCAAVSILTGLWSGALWRSLRNEPAGHPATETDRFISALSFAMAVVALLYVLFSTLAVVFLQCQR
jgi:hypothetical protein